MIVCGAENYALNQWVESGKDAINRPPNQMCHSMTKKKKKKMSDLLAAFKYTIKSIMSIIHSDLDFFFF